MKYDNGNRHIYHPCTSTIEKLPASGVAIFREIAMKFVEFASWLEREIGQHKYGTCKFQNIDISGVQMTTEEFGILLRML